MEGCREPSLSSFVGLTFSAYPESRVHCLLEYIYFQNHENMLMRQATGLFWKQINVGTGSKVFKSSSEHGDQCWHKLR